jgi:stearoyl-CoA desaturase (delta-9 desaturase)
MEYVCAKPKIVWRNILFFLFTALVALIGCPIYAIHHGVSAPIIGLTLFYLAATGMGITVGYHRFFAHATYKAHPIVKNLLLFFGAAAFEQSALEWSSQHRDHHRYVDTDRDPYDIKKGFFYAHMGWLMFWEHHVDYSNAHDLAKDPVVQHQHKHYIFWALTAGVITPVVVGWMMGDALGAFLFAVCMRITFVYQSTFCINSVCHLFGTSTYDAESSAKDNWVNALVTYGEGYHNFHHRFPSDYRNGIRWYHWDPSKWFIAFLAKLGLAWELKTVSDFRIMAARLQSENIKVTRALEALKQKTAEQARIQAVWTGRYELVRRHLTEWQSQFESYQGLLCEKMHESSHELQKAARKKMKEARRQFKAAHGQWKRLVRQHPSILQSLLLSGAV